MLDEPFAGVDPIAVEDIQEVVYKLKSKNIGILITDHNAQETLRITDRAYLLFEGKILFQGTSEELAANPVVREKYLGRSRACNNSASGGPEGFGFGHLPYSTPFAHTQTPIIRTILCIAKRPKVEG